MDSRTRSTLVTSLSLKVRRRICPNCRRGLQHAIVEVTITEYAARVGFICPHCDHQATGIVQLSERIRREIETEMVPAPISSDEVDAVRVQLARHYGSLTDLFT